MPSIMHTLFYFLVALAVLIAFHEFGHFLAARKLGVKVLRFSLGFGNPIWSYRKSPDSTEFTVGALPLGGYVKMVDEREGEVAAVDLPYAFNRQSLSIRSAIVFAGPFFNFLLAILIYWVVFMVGETGTRPVLGPIAKASLAEQAGFREGDEILSVANTPTPTWNLAISVFFEKVLDEETIPIEVRTADGERAQRLVTVPADIAQQPELLHNRLGFAPWQPSLPAVIDKIEPKGAAEAAGLQPGDKLVSVDGVAIKDWQQWVEYVRSHPAHELKLMVDREGIQLPLQIRPAAVDSPQGKVGRIGASVRVPQDLLESMQVEYRLGLFPAFAAAIGKTADYSLMTLKMIGRMIIGKAAIQNLSGPISIAQYAGQSASLGLVQFLKFLAIVSVSLAVLNLLPIPVLDGGHLMFYLVEAIKGSPVSEQTQALCQQIGVFILLSLMALAFFLDIERLLT
jgi:regulator of sigma E protease